MLAEGRNINITLLFSIASYERVAWAYIEALEKRHAAGQPIDRIASVASFFVSRVDTLVDKMLDEKIAADPGNAAKYEALKGKIAVANAKLAYAKFQEIFGSDRFAKLEVGRRAPAAPALGQHRHQEPGLLRHALRRYADRPGHGQHHAGEDDRRLPRSRHD